MRGLEVGADDFLTKPIDGFALTAPVRNLARLKLLTDEMLMRASTEEQMGFAASLGARSEDAAPAALEFLDDTPELILERAD